METRSLDSGRAVVLDDAGNVLRQLVSFSRTQSGKTLFGDNYWCALTYPSRSIAVAACKSMHWPQTHIEKGRSLMGDFWFIRNDFRDKYALAAWD